jgi:16S rRNA (adenine1518-N6/adenine1519-N6)-dimethyltransferase
VTGETPFGPARRSLGQNFLVDANLQRKIVDAIGAGSGDDVLEIGPGRGALTRHLTGTVRRLVLVELDDDLARALEGRYGARDDVEVVHGDVLQEPLRAHFPAWERVHVVGNIPYNITSPILFTLLEAPRPRDIVLMVQDEVADRLAADVGTKAYGALSVGVRSVAEVEKLFRVGRGAFRPVPGVDSAVIRIRPRAAAADFDEARLRDLVRAAFQWRRKQMRKILRDHPDLRLDPAVVDALLRDAGLEPTVRPERISPETFVALSAALP